jgi:hypothetical protein
MEMRTPMLIATGMVAILMAASGVSGLHSDKHFPSTPQQYGPRAGNDCGPPMDLDHNSAKYACPQNRSPEQPQPKTPTSS